MNTNPTPNPNPNTKHDSGYPAERDASDGVGDGLSDNQSTGNAIDSSWRYKPARDTGLTGRARLTSTEREAGLVTWLTSRLWWAGCGGYLRRRHGLKVTGTEHAPTAPPFVVVANHSSHLDALVIAAALGWRARDHLLPLAAGDTFFQTPAKAFMAAVWLNALPMWRKRMGRHSLGKLRDRLIGEPCGFVLFPEGTRSRTGEFGRFKPGIGMLVAGQDVPVIPAWIGGAYEAWPPDQKRPSKHPINVTFGKPLSFADATNDRAGWNRISDELESAVRELGGISPID